MFTLKTLLIFAILLIAIIERGHTQLFGNRYSSFAQSGGGRNRALHKVGVVEKLDSLIDQKLDTLGQLNTIGRSALVSSLLEYLIDFSSLNIFSLH